MSKEIQGFVADKADFLKLFARVHDVVDKKHTRPILTHFRLCARDSKLGISATDLFLGIKSKIATESPAKFDILLPAKETTDRMKNLPDGLVKLTIREQNKVLIESVKQKRKFNVDGLSPANFPVLSGYPEECESFDIPVRVISDLIERTIFSCSQDLARPHMNGALFELENHNRFRMVTTDGFRLTKCELTVPTQQDLPNVSGRRRKRIKNFSLLLPLKGLHVLNKLCSDLEDDQVISFVHDKNDVYFEYFESNGADHRLSIRLPDAEFVVWQSVVQGWQTDKCFNVRIQAKPLIASLQALLVDVNEKTGQVVLTFSNKKLEISTGTASDELELFGYDSKDSQTIGFNARYLLDALIAASRTTDLVQLDITNNESPIWLSAVDKTVHFLAIIMPIRIPS